MHEVTADIPRAVDQIFEELGVDEAGSISEDEWEGAWQNFPELLDMMSLRGLSKTAHWAAIVVDQVVANQEGLQGEGRAGGAKRRAGEAEGRAGEAEGGGEGKDQSSPSPGYGYDGLP